MLYDELFTSLERARWAMYETIPFDDIDPSLMTDAWIQRPQADLF